MRVRLVGWTHFEAPPDVPWSTDADGGQALAEFAGRACYASWSKPNPATATNAGYLAHILQVGHGSVLEHAVFSFYLVGISRSLTHELIRHRHFSYSQLSQRYVPAVSSSVEPDVIAADPGLHARFVEAVEHAHDAYTTILAGLQAKLGTAGTAVKKQARQAARAVLPNAAETRIVVTGNARAWRHFVAMRATPEADVEIRAVAVECLRQLQAKAPALFAGFRIVTDVSDGTEVAVSDLGGPSGSV
jgi:thymidylate synthase (FAD)